MEEVIHHPMKEVEGIYERIIEQFPTYSQIYISLIEHYARENLYDNAEEV